MHRGFRLMIAAAMVLAAGAAKADSLKIGVLSDFSGPYADVLGDGSVAAAKLAVEDMGGKVLGMPIEIIQPNLRAMCSEQ